MRQDGAFVEKIWARSDGCGVWFDGCGFWVEGRRGRKSKVGMWSKAHVQVSSSKGAGAVGFGFRVLGFRLQAGDVSVCGMQWTAYNKQ